MRVARRSSVTASGSAGAARRRDSPAATWAAAAGDVAGRAGLQPVEQPPREIRRRAGRAGERGDRLAGQAGDPARRRQLPERGAEREAPQGGPVRVGPDHRFGKRRPEDVERDQLARGEARPQVPEEPPQARRVARGDEPADARRVGARPEQRRDAARVLGDRRRHRGELRRGGAFQDGRHDMPAGVGFRGSGDSGPRSGAGDVRRARGGRGRCRRRRRGRRVGVLRPTRRFGRLGRFSPGVTSLRATGRFRAPRRVAGSVGLVPHRRRAVGASGGARTRDGRREGRVGEIDRQAVDHAREHGTQQRGRRRRRRRGLADGVEQRRGLAVRPAQHRAEKRVEFRRPPALDRPGEEAAIRPPRRQQRGAGLEVARFVPRPGLAPLDPAGRQGARSDVRRRRRPSGLGGRPRTERVAACRVRLRRLRVRRGFPRRRRGGRAARRSSRPWSVGPSPGVPGRAEVPAGRVGPCCRRGRRRGRGGRAARRVAAVARIRGPRDRVDAVRTPRGRLGRQPCGRGCHRRNGHARRLQRAAGMGGGDRLGAAQAPRGPVRPCGGGRRGRRSGGARRVPRLRWVGVVAAGVVREGGGRVRPCGGGRRGRRSGGAVCRVPRLQWVGVVAAGVVRDPGGRVVGPRGGGRRGRRSGGAVCRVPRLQRVGVARGAGGRVVSPRGGGRCGRRSGGAVCRVPRLTCTEGVAAGVVRWPGGRIVGPRGGGRRGRCSSGAVCRAPRLTCTEGVGAGVVR